MTTRLAVCSITPEQIKLPPAMNRKARRAAQKKSKRPAPSNASNKPDFLYSAALGHYHAGQFAEAERICSEIVTRHPNHGESLNLLGLIAHQTGRNELASQLIGKALISDPQSSSFHYSAGFILHAGARVHEAIMHYKKAIALNPNAIQTHMALANAYLEQHRLDEAALECQHALRIKPDQAAAFFLLGNVLQLQNHLRDSIAQYEQALQLGPTFPELHNNLGNALRQQGHLKEAVAQFRESVRLKPDNPEAWNNLGLGLQQQAHFPEAVEAYERALALRPTFVVALLNLSTALLMQGKVELALSRSLNALEIAETPEIKALFVRCARSLGSQHSIQQPDTVERILIRALSEPWGRPSELAHLSARLLKLNSNVDGHIKRAGAPNESLDLASLSEIYKNQLLRALLLAAPVSDLRLERFLTVARRAILECAAASEASDCPDPSFMKFATALAQQCFINEYIFSCDHDESIQANNLRELLIAALQSNAPVPELWIAAIGAYFPLHSLPADLDQTRSWSEPVAAIIVQQVVEPKREKAYLNAIRQLTEVANEVSFAVQRQYEDNPYPRWVKTSVLAPTTLGKLLGSLFPHVPFPDFELRANILIAGCGTGQQSIEMAMRFPGARILAVDLSLASLCYASRKTFEAGLNNVQYAQADILRLDSPDLKFDFIEATGVLHHLEDPLAGWSSLLGILRTDGVMRVGLYSATARREIVKAQENILQHGYRPTATDIRKLRHDRSALDGQILTSLAATIDFYSVSGCRDALFNVKEHNTDLLTIHRFITKNPVRFLGFSIDESVLHLFRKRFPHNFAADDLLSWHLFEKENPDTFVRMYQFWIQKLG
jgi:tetratricopeptide (TPR) repeat protein/SAM-dependent methyltransferase